MHNFVYLAKVHEPLPHPTSIFFSSDFGNSHDPVGLRLGEGHVPLYAPCGYATGTLGNAVSLTSILYRGQFVSYLNSLFDIS